MFKYQGMVPALKYMVMTSARYQKLRFHISRLVVRYPAKAEQRTIRAVARMVRLTVTMTALPKSCTSFRAR